MHHRIVLFGESGFVGSNLLSHIEREIAAPTLAQANLTDIDSLRSVLRPGDIVINAAGYANATDYTDRGKALFQSINVDGVRNLAEAAAAAGVAQLIHLSSVDAMGRLRGEGLTEEMGVPPVTPYAQSKLAGERILAAYREAFPVTILRPTSVFGERRGLTQTLYKIARLGIVPLPHRGSTRIPFSYVGNVARSVELCLGNEACYGKTFIVGDEDSYALRDIMHELARAMGRTIHIVPFPTVLAAGAAYLSELVARPLGKSALLDTARLHILTCSISYSIAAFRTATGYTQPFTIREAIQRVAAALRQ